MFGWLSAEAAFASCTKRRTRSSCLVSSTTIDDGKNFQSDFAIEFGVVGEINFTHATRAELGADFVAANLFAHGE